CVLSERHNTLRGGVDLANGFQYALLLCEGKETARFVIAKDVCSIERRARIRAINKATRDRRTVLPSVGKDRWHVCFALAPVSIGKPLKTLIHVPTMVLAAPDNVHLLVTVLAYVAHPEVPGQRIETEPPRLAESKSPNLRAEIRPAHKRIVRRDSVGPVTVVMIDVDAQHLSQEQCWILAMALRIFLRAGITHADIEVTVRPKLQSTAVMDIGRFIKFQQ